LKRGAGKILRKITLNDKNPLPFKTTEGAEKKD